MHCLQVMSLTVAAIVCLIASDAQAQSVRNADVSLALHMNPPPPLAPGSTALLTLTFTNAGPEPLPAVGAGSSGYPHLDFEQFSLVAAEPFPCQMYYDDLPAPPGQPGFLVASVFVGPLDPGQSKACTTALHVAPGASGSYALEFFATDGQVFIDDPTMTNNRTQIMLGFGPFAPRAIVSIPSVSLWGLGSLVFCLLVPTASRSRTI